MLVLSRWQFTWKNIVLIKEILKFKWNFFRKSWFIFRFFFYNLFFFIFRFFLCFNLNLDFILVLLIHFIMRHIFKEHRKFSWLCVWCDLWFFIGNLFQWRRSDWIVKLRKKGTCLANKIKKVTTKKFQFLECFSFLLIFVKKILKFHFHEIIYFDSQIAHVN